MRIWLEVLGLFMCAFWRSIAGYQFFAGLIAAFGTYFYRVYIYNTAAIGIFNMAGTFCLFKGMFACFS